MSPEVVEEEEVVAGGGGGGGHRRWWWRRRLPEVVEEEEVAGLPKNKNSHAILFEIMETLIERGLTIKALEASLVKKEGLKERMRMKKHL